MSVLQRTIRLFVMAAMAVAGPIAFSQNGYHPSAEPMNFDPDWQLFAPVQLQDMEDLSARQRVNKGFYLTYDRVFTAVSRSDTEAESHEMDSTWGNRFDFGWMKEDDRGWMFSVMRISGPNSYNSFDQQRVNAFIDPTADDFVERIYDVRDSKNVADYASFEANKVWRLEPYRYGGILEPMIGMRYANFRDTAQTDTYNVFTGITNEFGTDLVQENLISDYVTTNNHMVLGQIGFRYTKYVRRWTFSNDAKVFAGHVFQSQNSRIENLNSYFGNPVGAGDDPIHQDDRRLTSFSGRRNDESTVGFDIRVEGSYKATKHLDFRAGFQMLYFGRGIWRGVTPTELGIPLNLASQAAALEIANRHNQHVIMPGLTFGVAWNR